MTLLAIDCSANLCAACVYAEAQGRDLGRHVLDLGKGHAEHLMAVTDAALKAAEMSYADLGAIAVSVGPGSFTGIRVAVSAARGFALALGIPSVGIGTLEAIAAEARAVFGPRKVLAALASGEEYAQCAGYDELGEEWQAPVVLTIGQAAELARQANAALAGTAARRLRAALPGWSPDIAAEAATADIAIYAMLAAGRETPGEKPRPLYLREPDAKPQAGFILPRAPLDLAPRGSGA